MGHAHRADLFFMRSRRNDDSGDDLMSTTVAKRDPVGEVVAIINADDFKHKIQAAMGGNKTDVERFVRAASTAFAINPEVIVNSTRASVITSLLRCAQDGLLPDGREAALVQYGKDAAYLPMIGGFRKRAASHGFSLTAHVVYSGDTFHYKLGITPSVEHTPPALDIERGTPIGAYAVATHPAHGVFLEVMSKAEIENVRQSSRAKTGGPWSQHWGEMARKTVARRLFKQLPLGADERTASMLDADDAHFEFPAAVTADLPRDIDLEEEVEGEVFDPEEAA
jgi:recombination protein RecT